MTYIPYSTQEIDESDIDAVVQVMRSGFLTQGPTVEIFEEALKAYCGAKHAVAVASGTAGLHLACLALDILPGDTVWTSPLSFVASANCAHYVGAHIDFVDCDPVTGNMDIDKLEEKLRQAAENDTLPKLLIVVYLSGRVCDMKRIAELVRPYDIRIVEDAAHALGAVYAGRPVGACAYSDMTLFSFHPVKSITTGEGGALVTNDAGLAEKLRLLRSHGVTRDPRRMEVSGQPAWVYEMQELGYHYRMTDIAAALGTSQMRRLDDFISRRRAVAARYHTLLSGAPLALPLPDDSSAWHLYIIQVAPEKREAIFTGMRAKDIGVNVHYIPIHLQPFYQRQGFKEGDFPDAERFYGGAISLPIFPGLSATAQDMVVATLQQLLAG